MKINKLNFSFPGKVIFKDLDLDIEDGKTTCIMANSGVGKTTLLNLIAGLLKPTSGNVETNGKPGYIFQEPRLLPSLTVYNNVFAVTGDKQKTEKALADVELLSSKDLYPSELSGGMAQRASMARAFVYPCELLLMDEPFKGLDPGLKARQIKLLKKLINNANRTVLTVTHDVDEAFETADRIIVLDGHPATVVKNIFVNKENSEQQIKELKEFLVSL